ncbi:MAG: hypothetical protein OQK04_06415 [Kangiellaceae bacterium]|nr:hypothetical protein [Kangiellaceae bacterium]MCW8998332.1 hypothetical protein [Kangiellaceae bacterium]
MLKKIVIFAISAYFVSLPVLSKENIRIFDQLRQLPDFKVKIQTCPANLIPNSVINYQDRIGECTGEKKACLKECLANNVNYCFGLANVFQSEGINNDVVEFLYARACHAGLVSGCTNRAAGIMNTDNSKSLECSANTFKLTCKKEDAWGCTMYALALAKGLGTEKDSTKALEVLKGGCKYGAEDEACRYALGLEKLILEAKDSKSINSN